MTSLKIPALVFCHIIFSGVSPSLPLSTSDELSSVFLELSSYCLRLTLVHRLAPRTAPLRCSVSDMSSIKRFTGVKLVVSFGTSLKKKYTL